VTHDAPDAFWHSLHAVGLLRRPEHHVHFRYVVARGRSLHPPRRRDGHIQLVAPNCCPPPLALSISNGFVCTERMRTDQIAELEIMLEDHSVSGVLEALADCLERKAHGLLRHDHGRCMQRLTCERQAKVLHAARVRPRQALP
jgi:hypothetical protein